MNKKFVASTICFVLFLLFYGVTSRSDLQLTDEVAVFTSAISLATQGDIAIDELRWLNDEIKIGKFGEDKHLYSKYFPGNVIAAAVVYSLAEKQNDQPYLWNVPKDLDPDMGFMELAPSNTGARSVLKINAMFGALAMVSLFQLLKRYFDWKTTITTVILVGTCTNWWYQSRGFLSEIGAGALLITSLYFTACQKPYYSGLVFSSSLLFRPTNLIAFPIWGRSILDKGKGAIWSIFVIIVSVLGLAFFNWIRFDSIFDFGYDNESFVPNLFDGLYGILFSPGRSLFLYSPLLTLAIPGALAFYKKEKALTVISVLTVLSYLFIVASWHSWEGGWSWGSRLLTPIIPILGFLIAPSIEYAWGKRGDMLVVIALSLLGFGIQIIALAKNPVEILTDFVVFGTVEYNETINTVNNSWLALQLRGLKDWKICDLDAYTIRQWFRICR